MILGEYYRKEVIDPGTLTDDVCGFCSALAGAGQGDHLCDSAETTLIKGIRTEVFARHIPVEVRNARKGEIIDRIRLCDMLKVSQGRFFIMRRCRGHHKSLRSRLGRQVAHSDKRL